MFATLLAAKPSAPPAAAQASTDEVDKDSCPSEGTANEEDGNPLEGPLKADYLEDDPTETLPEPPPDEGRPSGEKPNVNLKPILRPVAQGQLGARASQAAQTGAVELSIRWCIVQPDAPGSVGERPLQFDSYDEEFGAYLNDPTDQTDVEIPIRTVRVLDAPEWAANPNCVARVQGATDVKMCPPVPSRYDEFQAFAQALAAHYGSASPFTVDRFALWNEPNTAENWGVDSSPAAPEGLTSINNRAEAYSDLLVHFHDGLEAGDPGIGVDAGEIAAGGAETNGTRRWTRRFAEYNTNQSRRTKFDVLTIHAYAKTASQVPEKVRSHLTTLDGVTDVGVTEVAWGVADADSSEPGRWKCVRDEDLQADRLTSLMNDIRASQVAVQRLAWFSVVDNTRDSDKGNVKCPDNTGHYDGATDDADGDGVADGDNSVRRRTNTYGLFKRQPNGTLPGGFAGTISRPLLTAFQDEQ
ncbi:hypothetical protein HJD18_14145 [Thermoleophilia bacterium SCSIO 60948]|nr:hypothetical protein HJD18_14145 [Thermoleophilia bacterium SCSIO 60948]